VILAHRHGGRREATQVLVFNRPDILEGQLEAGRNPFEQPGRPGTRLRICVFADEAQVGAPVHSFGLSREIVEEASIPAEFLTNALCVAQSSAVRLFPLALVCELVTVPAGENAAPIQDRNPAPAAPGRAAEPNPSTPIIAACPFEHHRAPFILPWLFKAAMSVPQNHAIRFTPQIDTAGWFPVTRPRNTRSAAGDKIAMPLQPPYIQP
jgi:hypothetical protein